MPLYFWFSTIIGLFWLGTSSVLAEISVQDAKGRTITLERPAQRIVSLAPHVTEMMFALGAGDRIVGTVHYSDFPPEAKEIPRVGGYHQLDLERIYALQPDLVIGWSGGNERNQVETLMEFGLRVFISEPHRITDIITNMETFAVLTGTQSQGEMLLATLRARWTFLGKRYAHRRAVRVFYQIWNSPLMTINSQHMIGDVIRQCGGQNVFGDLPTLIPKIGYEAVIQADPEVIIASGMDEERPEWLNQWLRWSAVSAVRNNHLYFIPPDLIQRHSPRILEGAVLLCEQLEKVRSG
uniref:Iron complex transport system substrate-binding protein n=1 Tax=Candidatus Kentrum sp. SD TaxID=2126332 RepID=A0A451BK53_9GAMM|nr:MAG: iron complex transport system substrate-binding protein [Candidatus Kentron sp. SD]